MAVGRLGTRKKWKLMASKAAWETYLTSVAKERDGEMEDGSEIEASCSSRLHLDFISPSSRLHLDFISPSSRLHLDFISTSSRLHLDFISPSSRLHLDFISTSSRLHLDFISTSSRLHLAFISPLTRLQSKERWKYQFFTLYKWWSGYEKWFSCVIFVDPIQPNSRKL